MTEPKLAVEAVVEQLEATQLVMTKEEHTSIVWSARLMQSCTASLLDPLSEDFGRDLFSMTAEPAQSDAN